MRTYVLPLLYWLAAIVGLVIALLADGWGDVLGLALLLLPMIPIARSIASLRHA